MHRHTKFHQNRANGWRDITFNVFTVRRYAKHGICRHCVCACVCVCVTLRYCIKTAKRMITQIMPL